MSAAVQSAIANLGFAMVGLSPDCCLFFVSFSIASSSILPLLHLMSRPYGEYW